MSRIDKYSFFSVFLFFIYLFPTFPTFTRTTGGRLGDIFLVAIAIGLMVIYLVASRRELKFTHFIYGVVVFLIFSGLIIISIFFELSYVSIRDLFEFHKPIYILLVFFVFASVQWDNSKIQKYIVNNYKSIFVIVIFYSFVEAFTGGIGNFISTTIYKSNRAILLGKATGSFGVTYFYAVFMIFSFYFFLFRYLFERKVLNLVFSLLSVICILASQSRTMIIVLAVSLVYLFFIYWSFEQFPNKKSFYITFFIFLGVIALSIQHILFWVESTYPYLYLGISALIEKGGVSETGGGSANIRYQQLLWVIENQSSFPLLGAGIGKATGPQLESFYALYLYRYGIIGITVYVIILIANYYYSIKCYKKAIADNSYVNASFFLAFSIFCITLPVSSISSVITDQPRFVVLYYGTLGIMLNYLYQNKKANHA